MARRCPYCRSKKWRKEAHSGALICSEGHVLPDHLYRNETTEATEFGPHAMRKRTLKSKREKKMRKSRANPIFYHGDRARFHYFQCLQLLLRMQVEVLSKLWKLPPEFEVICRDIWALHLSISPAPPPPEPFIHAQEHDEDSRKEENGKDKGEDDESYEERDDGSDKNASGESEISDDSPDESEDPEMIELLRQASESESSEEADAGSSRPLTLQEDQAQRPAKRRRGDDSPAGTIAVLVQALWMLRIPIIYNDLIDLINSYTLPYLDSVRLLPHSLVRHLTKQTKQALTPHFAPTPILLHAIASRLSKALFQRYGIFTPEFNASPVLWRAIVHMGGNASLYSIAKALSRHLELPLTLNATMAPPALRKSNTDPTRHKSDNVPPEIALIATVIIAVKMIYGLDGKAVRPRESWDPACTMSTLEAYLRRVEISQADENETKFKKTWGPASWLMSASQFEAGPEDHSADALDAYLDFCERALLLPDKEEAGEGKPGAGSGEGLLTDYFPLRRAPGARSHVAAEEEEHGEGNAADEGDRRHVERALELPAIEISEERKGPSVRPGESYAMYSAQDVLGTLPDGYVRVLKVAEAWTGVSRDDLSAVIERFERRLLRLWQRRLRDEETGVDDEAR